MADLGNCTRSREIIVDETMYDIRIQIQSADNVNPTFTVTDSNGEMRGGRLIQFFISIHSGYYGQPDGELKESDRYEAHFKFVDIQIT